MTEKRFTIDEKMLGYVGEFVSDNGIRIRELSDVVELLNQLHEENKELRAFQHNVFKNMDKAMKGDGDD